MNNKDIAMALQFEHEDELDGILSDVELVKRVKQIALDEYCITDDNASAVGREVLKLYGEVEVTE